MSVRFGTLEALAHATLAQLEEVDGVGKVVAESIVAWFADEDNEALLRKFTEYGVIPRHARRAPNCPLAGKSLVVTGTLETMSRDQAADTIRALGGIFQTSVGKDTQYLVQVLEVRLVRVSSLRQSSMARRLLMKLILKNGSIIIWRNFESIVV